MVDETYRIYACLGKDAFKTHSVAAQTAQKLAKKKHARVSPYKCLSCGAYHIGQKISNKEKKKVVSQFEIRRKFNG